VAAAERADQHLAEFEAQCGSRYPMIRGSWRGNWSRVIPFFQFPEEIRRVIYTTNAIEAMNLAERGGLNISHF
jgi:putative transposase